VEGVTGARGKTMILSKMDRFRGTSLDAKGTEQTAAKIKPQSLPVMR
jgi:hypothetical protein